jgi:Spy/CpxP family protein refolding chaperone
MRRWLLVLFLGCCAGLAQPPRAYFPWWESPLASEINLTEEQREKVRAIVQENRMAMIDQRAAVEKAELEVDHLFGDEVVDSTKAQDAIERLVAARSALTRSFTELSLKLRMVLTSAQWKELQEKRERWRPRGGGERPRRGPPPREPGGPPPGKPPAEF